MAAASNPGARLYAPKVGTGKRLSPKEREKQRKQREKEERRKRRERSTGRPFMVMVIQVYRAQFS